MKSVCVQGLGFVGSAMAVAIASVRDKSGNPRYHVTGVDRDNDIGKKRTTLLDQGEFPFPCSDGSLLDALSSAHEEGNLCATTDVSVYESADIVVVDVALDIDFEAEEPRFDTSGLEQGIRTVAERIPEDALILIETTVPPGTCEKILLPVISEELERRSLAAGAVHFAHSFERVMPGSEYLKSISQFWRVYAGATAKAANLCEEFLSTIVDVEQFPLTRVSSITASETAKVMENTYRATNIAFIDEWTKYAETVGIDLFEVIDSIRVRPTHSNIRFPGIGVGGYCLTKDPAFTPAAARQLFGKENLKFPFSELAMQVNQAMPQHSLHRLIQLLDGDIREKIILLLGVSYRQDVGDPRFSPVEALARGVLQAGANINAFDPFLSYWPEMDLNLPATMPDADSFDAVVFTTPHRQFIELDLASWLGNARPVVLDTVNVLSRIQRTRCRSLGVRTESIGRGDGL